MAVFDDSPTGSSKDGRDQILRSFGQTQGSARRYSFRRVTARRRIVYAIAAIAVSALVLELATILLVRR